jgi:SnoaL-like domain
MTDVGAIATRYIELVGARDLDVVANLIAENVLATTTTGSFNKAEWIVALGRLLPVLSRNEIRHVVVDGNSACVVYDFVTDTQAGAVPCAEWVTVAADGRMTAINLLFEKTNWSHVAAALQERAPAR